ncbi:D-alanyl-D-alanine carboxypeptidase [Pseudorhizobium flavum]|uniref:D-alanyl-D-alanine carboxypeptidase n=1 Tax=Pseudorhizobium flavum TaxID=1335061 RepID=UPI000987CA77|nr:D-alanyl-D-alanine carboxypeptidase [Pseudorhizobium flavum]CAD6606119.1 D-alanyl-D-alanine carboxypeptidase [Pseudorhizobium flavum]
MQAMSATVLKADFSILLPNRPANILNLLLGLALTLTFLVGAPSRDAQAAPKYAGIVVDANTGKVLYSDDPDGLRYPASLTKMMTLYLTFEALEAGRIRLDSKVPMSKKAAAEPPSKLGVGAGNSLTVEQAIKALVTRSANDVATALGEFLGGSESRFAQIMTNKARALGMTRTTYRNAHGLPNTAQMTTARDQARLGMALRQHFPQYYGYFSTRSFKFGKQTIGNHNRLLGSVEGVDGIKTGYVRASGFNLVTSLQKDGRSIVAVVIGGRTGASRDAQMRKLVGQYLPKASRGGKGALIAQAPSAPVGDVIAAADRLAAFDLPSSGPVPQARYEEQQVASAYSPPSSAKRGGDAMRAIANVATPTPAPEYLPPEDVAVTEQGDTSGEVDVVTTASTKAAVPADTVSGWVIQVGVSPDAGMASELLQKAQDKGGKVLRSAKPFTVAVNANGQNLYRARFAGFENQTAAVNTCKALKKQGVNCWASQQ